MTRAGSSRGSAPGPPVVPASGSSRRSAPETAGESDPPTLAGADGFASRPPRPPREPVAPARSTDGSSGAGSGPAGRHRRGRDGEEPEDDGPGTGPGRQARREARNGSAKKAKRKGSFWRELPILIVVAIVLTFVIQTFFARIYVIPSASMERTLHGCTGCANDRVAVDKLSYRFTDPSPGDVVVFRGPPAWEESEDGAGGQRSSNVLARGFKSFFSQLGLAAPEEKDFVKRVIATGGQTVACCDDRNQVTVDGRALDEASYLYFQPGRGNTQDEFAPVRVPDGQLWVMGDNRNNSSDARVHGPISVDDVIGKARVIVLPVPRWGGVPDTDPQAQVSALGAPGWGQAAPAAAGLLGAVPVVGLSRRLRPRRGAGATPAPRSLLLDPPPDVGHPDR